MVMNQLLGILSERYENRAGQGNSQPFSHQRRFEKNRQYTSCITLLKHSVSQGQYVNIRWILAMCSLYDAARHKSKHHNAVNRIEIHLKTRWLFIFASRLVFDTIVTEQTIYAAANVVDLFL